MTKRHACRVRDDGRRPPLRWRASRSTVRRATRGSVTDAGTDAGTDAAGPGRKRFSIVSAVHDVARYLPDFIASIEAQRGSTWPRRGDRVDDGSHRRLARGAAGVAGRRHRAVTVLSPSRTAARPPRATSGLSHATGEWVTFIDPDDTVATGLPRPVAAVRRPRPRRRDGRDQPDLPGRRDRRARRHATRCGGCSPTATGSWTSTGLPGLLPRQRTGGVPQPGTARRAAGCASTSGSGRTSRTATSAPATCCACPAPLVGFLASAGLPYRKRLGRLLDAAEQRRPGRALHRRPAPRLPGPAAARRPPRAAGRAPEWVQNMSLRAVVLLQPEDATWSTATAARGPWRRSSSTLLGQIRAELDDDVIAASTSAGCSRSWRQLLLHGARRRALAHPVRGHPPSTSAGTRSWCRSAGRGPSPRSRCSLRGVAVEPVATKVRALTSTSTHAPAARAAQLGLGRRARCASGSTAAGRAADRLVVRRGPHVGPARGAAPSARPRPAVAPASPARTGRVVGAVRPAAVGGSPQTTAGPPAGSRTPGC